MTHMNLSQRRKWLLFVSLLFIALVPALHAQNNSTIGIVAVDAKSFPDVVVLFRALDSSGAPLTNLSSNDVEVYENNESVAGFQIARTIDGPSDVVFVIDLGQQNVTMSAGTRRETLLHYANNYFRDGVDSAALILVNDTGEGTLTLAPTTSRDAFVRAVNSADLTHNSQLASRGLAGVEQALELVDSEARDESTNKAVILLTDSIYAARPGFTSTTSDAQSLNAMARDQRVPLYVFQTDSTAFEPLEVLASNTGGQRIFLGNTHTSNQTRLDGIFRSIQDRGLAYEGSFRSTNGESGDRRVTILPRGTPLPGPANSSANYSVTLSPAAIIITTPADGARFVRTASREGNSTNYDLNTIDVTAEISGWPDEHPRKIMLAELLVNGAPKLTIRPDPTATRLLFPWDISDVRSEGVNMQTLEVRIRDELGMESTSPTVTAQIVVVAPPPAVSTPGARETPPPIVVASPCDDSPTSRECLLSRATLYGPWIVLAILAIAFLLMFRRLNQAIAAARQTSGSFGEKVNEARKTLLGGGSRSRSATLATLEVITARPDLMGQIIELDGSQKTIGRDPRLVDIQLYGENDPSSVSGLHCTIQYDRRQETFLLTDNNSTNGTTINNRQLNADDPTALQEGDIIVLGNLFKQGAKLRFEVAKTGTAATPVSGSSKPAGNITEQPEEFMAEIFAEELPGAGTPTLLDTEVDIIDIVPPNHADVDNKKDDRSWLDDLE